jgi:hypothetical protein
MGSGIGPYLLTLDTVRQAGCFPCASDPPRSGCRLIRTTNRTTPPRTLNIWNRAGPCTARCPMGPARESLHHECGSCIACISCSQFQTARANSAHRSRGAIAPGSWIEFATPRGGGAPTGARMQRHPAGLPCASKTRVNALSSRQTRRLRDALRPSSEGRAPFGAPPWRFVAVGRASVCGIILRSPCSELLAAGS